MVPPLLRVPPRPRRARRRGALLGPARPPSRPPAGRRALPLAAGGRSLDRVYGADADASTGSSSPRPRPDGVGPRGPYGGVARPAGATPSERERLAVVLLAGHGPAETSPAGTSAGRCAAARPRGGRVLAGGGRAWIGPADLDLARTALRGAAGPGSVHRTRRCACPSPPTVPRTSRIATVACSGPVGVASWLALRFRAVGRDVAVGRSPASRSSCGSSSSTSSRPGAQDARGPAARRRPADGVVQDIGTWTSRTSSADRRRGSDLPVAPRRPREPHADRVHRAARGPREGRMLKAYDPRAITENESCAVGSRRSAGA